VTAAVGAISEARQIATSREFNAAIFEVNLPFESEQLKNTLANLLA
jgi:hypothetical protein